MPYLSIAHENQGAYPAFSGARIKKPETAETHP